ncbi:hypothetical protein H181DRAFT_01775 [Streptomyces sp. WMMB 714]|uniref:hypothetical protein n=1 Tax=Streptomyces sp. WMMB 714 TaxID=1286822 RepID=UPI0005F765C6|nr:hypothetical protein [Streptomyces sp. WMMB 714]SCK23660.1 hypothetical protein H181DRAFT_01775 [Streptomyces sp. WMMB 714]
MRSGGFFAEPPREMLEPPRERESTVHESAYVRPRSGASSAAVPGPTEPGAVPLPELPQPAPPGPEPAPWPWPEDPEPEDPDGAGD